MKKVLRISRARFDPAKADKIEVLLKEARAHIWPKQEKLTGYIEGYTGIDRANGAIVWATFWDTTEHGAALGALPEMRASGLKLVAEGLVFEPITNHELFD